MEVFIQVVSIVGGILVSLPGLLAAVIAVCKAIPGEQPDKFLETKVKPDLDKILSLYGLLTAKK
jgi:UPF0716 family protein affecting phage T7 exclusion